MRLALALVTAITLSACGSSTGRDDEVKITFKFGDQHSLMTAGCASKFFVLPIGPEVPLTLVPFVATVDMSAAPGTSNILTASPFSILVRKGNPRYFAAFGNIYWQGGVCVHNTAHDASYPAIGISDAVDLQGPVTVTIPITISHVATKVYAIGGATLPAVTPFVKMRVKWKTTIAGTTPEGANCTSQIPLFNAFDGAGLEARTVDSGYKVCLSEHEVWPLHPNRKYYLSYKIHGKCKIFERFITAQREQVTELDWATGSLVTCPP